MRFDSLHRSLIWTLFFALLGIHCGEAPDISETTPRPLVDQDGDGYASKAKGGPDCNDKNPQSHPLVPEIKGNDQDENCNNQKNEVTATTGYWVIQTPDQTNASWLLDIQTDPETGNQFIRCLQFIFSLVNSINGNQHNVTHWKSNLQPDTIKIRLQDGKTVFNWKLDEEESSVKIEINGEIVDTDQDRWGDSITGKIIVKDLSPTINAEQTFSFTGTPNTPDPKDERVKTFCERCYENSMCVQATP